MLGPANSSPRPSRSPRGGLPTRRSTTRSTGLRSETGSARVDPAALPLALELLDRALEDHERARSLSVSPERRAAIRRRLRFDLERYLSHAAESGSSLEPSELELGFGFDARGRPWRRLDAGAARSGRWREDARPDRPGRPDAVRRGGAGRLQERQSLSRAQVGARGQAAAVALHARRRAAAGPAGRRRASTSRCRETCRRGG